MSFSILSSWLSWAVIAAAIAAAMAAFLITPSPVRQVIASLDVWQRVFHDRREPSFWERARWLVSLVLTALIALLIAVAFARPAVRSITPTSGRALFVLDSSWSMRARTPAGPTRWDLALGEARAAVDASNARELAVATTADGVVEGPTSDLALIHSALARLQSGAGADGAWPRVAGVETVHFFTDGATPRPPVDGLVVHSVFVPVANVAITAFDVRPSSVGEDAAEAFLSVANFNATPQRVQMIVTRDATVVFDRSVDLPSNTAHREVIPIGASGGARFHAHVSAPANALDLDDDAVAWLAMAEPLQVTVVGVNSQVPALLGEDASLRVFKVEPGGYPQAKSSVWVFDGWLPAQPPSAPALVINPPATSWLGETGADESQPIWLARASHPILDGIDTALVQLSRAKSVRRPSLEPLVVSARNTPLVSVEDSPSGRYVVLGFPAGDPGFAVSSAFPILIGNAIDWLGRPELGVRRQPGPIALPAATTRVVAPTGEAVRLAKFDDRVTATLTMPGLYLVESAGGQSVLTVGLGDPARSNLQLSTLGAANAASASRVPVRPWWMYAALAAFGLVALEWITWRRRVTV